MLADQSTPSTSTSGNSILRRNQNLKYHLALLVSFLENPDEEKKEREHLLALNQMIAQQALQKRRSLPGNQIDQIVEF